MTSEKLIGDYSKEFITRTKKILEQYEEIVEPKLSANNNTCNEYYDVTLFINCLYGLLMMPSKLNNKQLKTYGMANKFLKDKDLSDAISFYTTPEKEITTEALIRAIRNGLGHWNEGTSSVDYEPKQENKLIEKINICGSVYNWETKITVTIDISSEDKRKKVFKFLEFIHSCN